MNIYEMIVLTTAWITTGVVVSYAIRKGVFALWALWIPLLVSLLFPSFYNMSR